MKTRATLLLALSLATTRAAVVANGGFEDNPASPALITPWQTNGAATLARDALDRAAGQFSLRVTGRAAAADGPTQALSFANGLTNGFPCVTRLRIKADAPAQVRALVMITSSAPQTPLLLAETVVRPDRVGQWVQLEGRQTVAWTGNATAARLYFAVEQIHPAAAPAGAFPSYRLDEVIVERDTDQDGLTDAEEATLGTLANNADTDGDRMPDRWESRSGLNPLNPGDAGLDADLDGHSNHTEYWANTSPTNAASFPGIPSDPLASPATRALIYHLQTRPARPAGARLTGQHAQDVPGGDYTTYVAGLNTRMAAAGFPGWVSVLGIAAEGPSAAQPLQIQASAPVGRAYIDAGGLVVLHWTPRNPWTNNFNGDKTGVDITDLLTPGTVSNVRFTGWMDILAAELALFGPDRPVIFRPFSEMNGSWNWYGRLTQDDYVRLYRWLRAYLVDVKGLHHIVWTLESHIGIHRPAGLGNAGVSMEYYYPGDDAIDLVGFSAYVHNWDPGCDTDAVSREHPKAFAITEGGPPANEDDTPNGYNALYLDALDRHYPRAAFFVVWNSFPSGPNIAIQDNPGYVELLTDPRAANRENLFWRSPASLAAQAVSSASLALSWPAQAGATGYRLESGGGPWSTVAATTATNAVVSGLAPASAHPFRVRALYGPGDSAPLAGASAATWSLYQQWKQDRVGSILAPDLADGDGDGLPLILEYAAGADPFSDSSDWRPFGAVIGSGPGRRLGITFRRRPGDSGVTYAVEATGDLLNGPWVPLAVPEGPATDNGDGTETVTFRDLVDADVADRRYLRLRVEAP